MAEIPGPARRWLGRLAAGAAMLIGLSWLRHRSRQLAHGGSTPSSDTSALALGYEPQDMDAHKLGWVLLIMAVTASVLVGLVFLMIAVLHHGNRARYAGLTTEQIAPVVPPLPHLQVHPFHDLALLRGREEHRLHSYVWLDAAHTHARIPIDRAMALEVGRGLGPSQ